MDPPDDQDVAWATSTEDTRERTCTYTLAPIFSLQHTFRLSRYGDRSTEWITRTYEVGVEWTSLDPVTDWLSTVADALTPYDGKRFAETNDGTESAGTTADAASDGRFRAAPVDATLRPTENGDPLLSEPYHYWNSPLARVQADEEYPDGVTSLTLDLVDGPTVLWTGEATAGGVSPDDLDPGAYPHRVGLEYRIRERLRRPVEGDAAWTRDGGPGCDDFDDGGLPSLLDETLAPSLHPAEERIALDGATPIDVLRTQAESTWRAYQWSEDEDPFEIPEPAVSAATTTPEF